MFLLNIGSRSQNGERQGSPSSTFVRVKTLQDFAGWYRNTSHALVIYQIL